MTAGRVWTVRDALDWTVSYFERGAVPNPRRSAEWLLSSATGLSRVELYAHFDRPLTDTERAAYRDGVERRAAGEPLQYVTGEMPFRHVVLKVVPGVFIPRPETEVLVDEALAAVAGVESPLVVDLCAGSGAVGVSIAFERPEAVVHATEIVPVTARTARENAERCGVADRVTVHEGDLFDPLPTVLRGKFAVVAANPPYVPTADLAGLPEEVAGFEPRIALDGGADGLDVVRRIAAAAQEWLSPGGTLVVELDEGRVADAVIEATSLGYLDARAVRDLTGRDRVLVARSPSAR